MPAPIRPFNPPALVQTPTQVRPSDAARQAQRAFFQQALGAPTTAQPAQAARAAAAVAPVRSAASQAVQPHVTPVRTQPIPDEKPIGYRRPGSYVDIKV